VGAEPEPRAATSGRSFEDFGLGDTLRSNPIEVRDDTILAFAHLYDPQPFHTDPDFARETIFGGLIASGWQALSETFAKALEDGFLADGALSSEGLEDLRWLLPVRPGDAIRLEFNVLETIADGYPADRGCVVFDVSALNQKNEIVMSYKLRAVVHRRMASMR
jgi:acyl dehydratase